MNKVAVLFVCMGNICRSPSAQGVFEKLIEKKGLQEKFTVDSAGTNSYHVGHKPDTRSQFFAKQRGIDITKQSARKVCHSDFEKFDYIMAMDDDNYFNLLTICPQKYRSKIHKMIKFSPNAQYTSIPDPYYGGEKGFELVLDLLQNACNGLLAFILPKSR